jgi:hypothetical protein
MKYQRARALARAIRVSVADRKAVHGSRPGEPTFCEAHITRTDSGSRTPRGPRRSTSTARTGLPGTSPRRIAPETLAGVTSITSARFRGGVRNCAGIRGAREHRSVRQAAPRGRAPASAACRSCTGAANLTTTRAAARSFSVDGGCKSTSGSSPVVDASRDRHDQPHERYTAQPTERQRPKREWRGHGAHGTRRTRRQAHCCWFDRQTEERPPSARPRCQGVHRIQERPRGGRERLQAGERSRYRDLRFAASHAPTELVMNASGGRTTKPARRRFAAAL